MDTTNSQRSTETIATGRRDVLVVEDDLFFSVRIENTLKKAGYTVQVVSNGEQALSIAAEGTPMLIIVNFGSERLAPAEIVRKLKALPHPAPIMGFVPHKWMPQVRPVAMAAGCDLLVANSALAMRLPQLAARLAPLDGAAVSIEEAAKLAAEDEKESTQA